ncbi:MAG: AAA family ATPase, partial [Lachnospiraceae bacterium]|nr:AAA family ATPase [Lachnospiraceae bacterium]
MNFSEEAARVLQEAVSFAKQNKYEYVTPETLLLMLCDDEDFICVVEDCGGDPTELAAKLSEYHAKYIGHTDADPETSAEFVTLLDMALRSALASGNDEIGERHVIHAMWKLEHSYAIYYMKSIGLDEQQMLREMTALYDEDDDEDGEYSSDEDYEDDDDEDDGDRARGDGSDQAERDRAYVGRTKGSSGRSWQMYAPCLNDTLTDVNPLIGRDAEIERTIQILCRKDKNNPLHIGEPGVGKTAITYGLVQRIKNDEVPELLKGSRIFSLDLAGMLAGTQYRGDFEKRFKKVLSEIEKEEKPIIYLDEIHNITGAGAVGEGSFDAANMLKSYLSDGHIRFIGSTTFEEYKKYFEKNKSLVRRFQNVEIKEPSRDETVAILNGLKDKYEKFHGVRYADGVLEYAVDMSTKHINERFLPDKAIDLMDEAGAYRKLYPDVPEDKAAPDIPVVDKDVINTVLTSICRVPVESVDADDISGLATLEERIKGRVFGQDEAVSQVVNAIKFSKAGLLEDNKPLASLLFVGPTGVGKTEIAKCLAKELGVKLIRFDMSEYGEKHNVAKLIGAPAGYVGYEEGGLLTE